MLELRQYNVEDPCGSQLSVAYDDDEFTSEEKKEPSASTCGDQGTGGFEENDGEMRGVHAKVHIPPNTVCVAVPRRCLITVEMGQATEMGLAILKSDLELDAPKHIFLMVYLLWDRKVNGKTSFFNPYYEILPRTLRNMPIFWNEKELKYLEGSYLLTQIVDRNEAIEDDYHAICEVAPEFACIATLEEFKWARMCVCSRNFGLQIDGKRTSALVPHADMLNHYRPRETKWTFDDERQAFTITSLQTIPYGAQVYDSYGQKCNHRFLLNYGFAVEDNREVDGFCPNEVPIELGILPNDPIFDAKYEFWTRGDSATTASGIVNRSSIAHPEGIASVTLDVSCLTHVHEAVLLNACPATYSNAAKTNSTIHAIKRVRVCVSNNEHTRILFSMLRVIVADEEQFRVITSGGPAYADGTALSRHVLGFSGTISSVMASSSFFRTVRDIRCPISLKNERAAMNHLLDVLRRASCVYPTIYEQDVEDLIDMSAYPRFSNKRHAKIQVRGEKEVLLHFMIWARTALEIMDIIERELDDPMNCTVESEFEEAMRSMEEDDEGRHHITIVRYCVDVLGVLRKEEIKKRTHCVLQQSTTVAL